jgi:F-type H+-transporting ATPase subunit alpha
VVESESIVKFRVASGALTLGEYFLSILAGLDLGMVVAVGDGIAVLIGLRQVTVSEVILIGMEQIKGLVFNLESDSVKVIILGDDRLIKYGDLAFRTYKVISIPVGELFIGRVVNSLMEPVDGLDLVGNFEYRLINTGAPDVISREKVSQPLETGVKIIDALIPIGRGQRELIIGDRQLGKTAIALDVIINQQNSHDPVTCVYVAIGKRLSEVRRVHKILSEYNCMNYTVIIKATAADPAPLLYLAPYSGVTLGEYFRDKGLHSLVIYDDLSKHAVAYRQMSLLLRRPPAREAYPADIFFLHARLLERSAKLHSSLGGGSLTALPIIETVQGDIAAYIPTNVISITDGQIYLEKSLFKEGIRPAVSPGLSVSRVGSAAQNKIMKSLAGSLKLELAQYREVEQFTRFASDIDETTKRQIYRGMMLTELLIQPKYNPLTVDKQIILLLAGLSGFLEGFSIVFVRQLKDYLISFVERSFLFFPFRRCIVVASALRDLELDALRFIVSLFVRLVRLKLVGK